MDFAEMADAIDEATVAPLLTDAGRALAAPRIAAMKEFSKRLRQEYQEFSSLTPDT
jgi:late competence protein required for DNA uptake (superfamily II DNA/RNA helicase)